jgi:predicted Zn finger-like uncharacterized protein
MDVRCDRCKTQYTVDDAQVTEAGVTVRCPQCQHTFIVKKKAWVVTMPVKPGQEGQPSITLGAEPTPVPAPPAPSEPSAEPPKEREWRVRQANGNLFTFRDLTALQRWIVERKVTRDDDISADGQTWKRLGNIPELAGFFLLVDEAQRAAELQVQARLGLIPGSSTPEPPAPPPPVRTAMALPPEAPPAEPPKRGGNRGLLPVGLLALLGAGAGFYLGVLRPREEAAAREQAELRARLAKAEAEAQARANTPAAVAPTPGTVGPSGPGAVSPPRDDGGTDADGGALADAGEADAGGTVAETTPDAGLADAGTDAGMPSDGGAADAGAPLADAGTDGGTAPDAGAAVARRPEPVRDFDYWIAQGDRQRERERADPAMNAYDKAAELAPDRAEPYAGRGLVHLDLGDYSLAEAEFLRALKLNPRYAVALMGLAETYRSQGKKAEAIRYYERYLEVLPNGPEAAVARSALERLRE